MTNKTLYIIIGLLVLVVIIGGVYIFIRGANKQSETPPLVSPQGLSEPPNKAKFDGYFTGASLGKLAGNQEFNPSKVVMTSVFSVTDQFCTSLDIKKEIPSGKLGGAVYDVNSKNYVTPKSPFPVLLKAGNTIGCEPLEYPVGKYEQKLYVDDVLAIVLPFEVR